MRPVDLDQGPEEGTGRAQKKTPDTVQLPVVVAVAAVVLCIMHTIHVMPNNLTKDLRTRAVTILIRATITITQHRHPWADIVTHYLLLREISV